MSLFVKSSSTCDLNASLLRKARSTRGMTLIEMMIVVVILSVLTTLAITGYRKLIYQARNAEAYHFLGAIRATQNAYYQTYGQYAGTLNWSEWPEGAFPLENRINWESPTEQTWQHLGVRPEGPVWFKYRIRASDQSSDAPANAFNPAPNGPWFQAQGRGDFNGDQKLSTFEITSGTSEVFVENVNE